MALPIERSPINEPEVEGMHKTGSEEPFLMGSEPPVLDLGIVSEKRRAMETVFNITDATTHLLDVATDGKRNIQDIHGIVEEASRRIEEEAIDDLLELYDVFSENPTGELLFEMVDYLEDEKYVTGDNIVKFRRLVLVSGSILLIEHGQDTP